MKLDRTFLFLTGAAAAFAAVLALSGCETVGVSVDLRDGICAVSRDGNYAACYNPLTKGYTLKARTGGRIVKDLAYHSATKTYRADLPDGTTAVYGAQGLTFEPALPVK